MNSDESVKLHFNVESLKKRLSGNLNAFEELKKVVIPQLEETVVKKNVSKLNLSILNILHF